MNATPIAIREIDHLVLRTRNLQRLLGFYCEVLGCTLERSQADIGLVQLRAGRSMIDLFDLNVPRNQGMRLDEGRNMDHFCLRVEPFDAESILGFLRKRGCSPGLVESRYGAEGQGPSIYVDDPDGNTVELKGPPDGGSAVPH